MSLIEDAFTLSGKTAVVTGGGSGIGRETAIVLASAGARVVATDINESGLEETRSEATAAGLEVAIQPLDVSDPEQVANAIRGIAADSSLDVIVNAAGILIARELLEVTPEEFDRVLRVNLSGTFYACQSAARVMPQGGSIINLASAIIDRPSVGRGSYAISKGGVVQLTRTLALELGPRGIRVNAIAPGWVESSMTKAHYSEPDGAIDEQARAEYIAKKAAGSPLGVVGTARDIALTALLLASDAGRFYTGQVLRANGGIMMA